jgi:hypothetical protein
MVVQETNKFAVFSHGKSGIPESNWEDTKADEIEVYTGVLIHMETANMRILFL